jgi:phosphoribosylformylglycinamidine synthase subunit PurQ / glutaminase
MNFGVVVFPGANCDADSYHALRDVMQVPVDYIWHEERDISGYDCIVLPGGFTYGDYLRTGAVARFAPVMESVAEFAGRGGLVIGICNGFQILLEAGLLPGAMLRNRSQRFRCAHQLIRIENADTPFTNAGKAGQILDIPIAHGEGNYYCDEATLAELETDQRIIFRYCDAEGNICDEANPNGSLANIAGICNAGRNVLGMMPHPERCSDPVLGWNDGQVVFKSIINALGKEKVGLSA